MAWEVTDKFECSGCHNMFTQRQVWFDERVFVPHSEPDIIDGYIEKTKDGLLCSSCRTLTLRAIEGQSSVRSFPEGLLVIWKEVRM